jgi:hypothetical protein
MHKIKTAALQKIRYKTGLQFQALAFVPANARKRRAIQMSHAFT